MLPPEHQWAVATAGAVQSEAFPARLKAKALAAPCSAAAKLTDSLISLYGVKRIGW